MQIAETEINDVKVLKPVRFSDQRGFFSEVFKESELRQHGIDIHFVQDNHSSSASKWVIRGLHFEIPPFAQAKLLRVTAGSIFDVAVDTMGFPELWPAYRSGAQCRRMEPDFHSRRVCPRLLHARTGHGGCVQGE